MKPLASQPIADRPHPMPGNRALDDELAEVTRKSRLYRAAKKSVKKARNELLAAIYSAYVFVRQKGLEHEVTQRMRADGIGRVSNELILRPLIYWLADDADKHRASRWGQVLQLAEWKGILPEELSRFIKATGGIESCIREYRTIAWKTEEPKSRDKRVNGKLLGIPFTVDEAVEAKFLRIAEFKQSTRVTLSAKFTKGRLFIRDVKAFRMAPPES